MVEEKRAAHRKPDQGAALQLARRRAAAGHRQVRRGAPSWILPSTEELTPARIARVIAGASAASIPASGSSARLRFLDRTGSSALRGQSRRPSQRTPYFCSGCPHNTSTRVPEGSRALAGIGCHYMAQWMDRNTDTFTQMGGEGVPWVGQAPFTEDQACLRQPRRRHLFPFGHPGDRAAVARQGQHHLQDPLQRRRRDDRRPATWTARSTRPMITHQLHAEGVQRIVVVTDEPDKYPIGTEFAPGVDVAPPRRAGRGAARAARDARRHGHLIYDQTCAAEKRRRRKRGLYPDPPKRVFINELVCEGCGDCSVKSNCLSVVPLETEFGRKRAIDQSSCNKDFSCVNGFCPSFVTVHGGGLRKPKGRKRRRCRGADPCAKLPAPILPDAGRALRHPGHRRRRHRRGDHRRAARHGRAYRGQGRAPCST